VQDAGNGDVIVGNDSGADVVQPPAGCDPAADPKDAPKCVVSELGVFVDAAGGADSNPGTKGTPVKSITAALTKLGGKARVYVCEGTYPEAPREPARVVAAPMVSRARCSRSNDALDARTHVTTRVAG
jgi:hypothetical protein